MFQIRKDQKFMAKLFLAFVIVFLKKILFKKK
jgi:hypothetical protein